MHDVNGLTGLREWKSIFKATGIMTIVMLVLIPVQIVIFILFPQPGNVEGWLQLFHENPFLGMLHMDLLYLLNNLILVFIYLSFTILLLKKEHVLSFIALILGVIGIICYFASNKSIEMLFLNIEFVNVKDAVASEHLRSTAHSFLLEWKGTAFTVYYFLNAASLLIYSGVMLKNTVFGRSTAVTGLISGILMIIPSTFGAVGLVFSLLSLIPWYIFCIRISIIFFKISENTGGIDAGA